MFRKFYKNKRVFLTGHTGFKGSWLSEWLLGLGARLVGYSLLPETSPAMFSQLGLEKRLDHHIGDVRDAKLLADALQAAQPDVVFHLAAQPLVRRSYKEPVLTYETNVLGTVYLLEALRTLEKPCSVVVVTTDKCYENREWQYGYRENDPLGGHDPYSSSKACAELVVQSYRKAFYEVAENSNIAIASVRAGNVVGGGDWTEDRIIPDCIRALSKGKSILVRNPYATRPWQHVLEPLSGYLLLAKRLYPGENTRNEALCGAYNFGPNLDSNLPVAGLVERMLTWWPGNWEDASDAKAPHEAGLLNLSADKAWHTLQWRPVWNLDTTIEKTMEWYRSVVEKSLPIEQIIELTQRQISEYFNQAKQQKQQWVSSV